MRTLPPLPPFELPVRVRSYRGLVAKAYAMAVELVIMGEQANPTRVDTFDAVLHQLKLVAPLIEQRLSEWYDEAT